MPPLPCQDCGLRHVTCRARREDNMWLRAYRSTRAGMHLGVQRRITTPLDRMRVMLPAPVRFVLPQYNDYPLMFFYMIVVWPVLIYIMCTFILLPLADTLTLLSKALQTLVECIRRLYFLQLDSLRHGADLAVFQFDKETMEQLQATVSSRLSMMMETAVVSLW